MPNAVIIRPRRDNDLPALADVLVRVHTVDGYPVEGVTDPAAWLHHPHELQSWTAEVAGHPVGQITLAHATADDDAARVWHERTGGDIGRLALPVRLFVDPDHRGAGAGRLLMRTAAEHARSLNRSVAFDVMKKDRTAIRLYERMGAIPIGDITHHHSHGLNEPAVVYIAPTPTG
jgi:GNAT superfamily N-acetyltransferase